MSVKTNPIYVTAERSSSDSERWSYVLKYADRGQVLVRSPDTYTSQSDALSAGASEIERVGQQFAQAKGADSDERS